MKSKLSNCEKCPLKDQVMVIGETNCEDDLSKVDVLILAEAPANEEIKQNRPLVGQAGKIFREAFKKSGLEKSNYFISNVVLCANIVDKKTQNPPPEAVEFCKPNWQKLIEMLNPKIIFILGSVPMNAFGIAETGITKLTGFHKYNEHDVFLTLHPSYIQRNGGINTTQGEAFLNDFKKVVGFLNKTDDMIRVDSNKEYKILEEKREEPYYFKLPNWCYSADVCLIDCQHIPETRSILYIFKDKEGKKIFHKESADDNYYYMLPGIDTADCPMTIDISETNVVLGRALYNEEYDYGLYESDIKPEVKRVIDYRYIRKEEECEVVLKKMYADIEVYSKRNKGFPDPRKAESPINAISFKFNDGGPVNVWVAQVEGIEFKIDESKIAKNIKVRKFSDEFKLLREFAKIIKEESPEVLLGWNFLGFDMMTIYNRMRKIGVDFNLMSPVGITSVDVKKYGKIFIYGMHVMDMLDLYKELTYSVEESYKLDFIANKHLKTGKVSYDGSLDQLYEEDIETFINYSGKDTELLERLDERLGHIDLKFELIRICSSTWKTAETTMGLVDPLCVSYAKRLNQVCRNAQGEKANESIPGAYVRHPKGGRHKWVIDLDFTSLYPSIVCSCNIGPNTYLAKIDPELAHKIIYDRPSLKRQERMKIILNPIKGSAIEKEITIEKFIDELDKHKWIITHAGTVFKNHEKELSILYKIFTYLLDSRKTYKNKRDEYKRNNEESLMKKFNNIQQSYKILANSIYGVLANHGFRFFCNDLAKTITLTGQEVVKFSGYHLGYFMENNKTEINSEFLNGYEDTNIPYIIYQDTDSIFVAMGDYLYDKKMVE